MPVNCGSTPLQHWPNAWFFYTTVYSNHWTANQCWFNVDPTCLTIAQHSVYIGYLAAIAIGVTISSPVARKDTTQIHWPSCEIMLGHRLLRWANNLPTETLQALIIDLTTNIIVNIIISEHLLKTKVLNLRTWNVIFDMFIRTAVQKCQPFPTHSTPLSPK